MTGAVRPRVTAALPWGALRLLRDVLFGTLLCLTPVTAILALGWLTRRMDFTIRSRWHEVPDPPGWIMGAAGKGWPQTLLGGLAANVETGLRTAAGLFLLTLPFTLAWHGAWWAGWENSFNKGYEQSAVGPAVWLLATLVSLPVLAALPLALAHAATERRLGAFFEFRRIRGIAAAAGWRLPWLAALSVLFGGMVFVMRAVPVFIEGLFPGFTTLAPERQAEIAGRLDLVVAALVFAAMALLRHRAAAIYAIAAPRAAGGPVDKPMRSGSGKRPSRIASAIWFALACLLWLGLPMLVVAGQFINYAPALWSLHPLITLPWAG